MKLTDYRIILASNSPRRKELLSGIGVKYEFRMLPDIDESYPETVSADEVAGYLAEKKASAYLPELNDDELLITADTVVLLDSIVIGKPSDEADAIRMLQLLSGKTHKVITGVCLTSKKKQVVFSDTAYVTFGELSREEISYYVSNYKPYDKAGAYGVQEWIGYVAVEKIEGSYFNVMGLPIFKVYKELKQF
ncbi:MAG TPA: septum formation protein Maf [Fermentimonas caenicola]|jgi:septum formation protein|uniref:dTTP/UTP pyrophosphatase n=1 Tax=Fermentimonas caenicola TaxID=1562970 RepID=A0A098BXB7_9BACT|nr:MULTISPECIES: Maf-like protein [Lascolabacillus]MBP6176329.1 septum formation protein Maf [Fermentimonas sp.]MDI9626064.1 Maf-like protein [Bacteroidota bacterium]TAH62586.1 MAG: septum formation protein Maf [Fermentimonas caenicola]MBP6196439.1 septum formation protein Maf [Fermentimonas sp.]MBP7104465.1 septum formation protein Maf [Fermentimonas sp.]